MAGPPAAPGEKGGAWRRSVGALIGTTWPWAAMVKRQAGDAAARGDPQVGQRAARTRGMASLWADGGQSAYTRLRYYPVMLPGR